MAHKQIIKHYLVMTRTVLTQERPPSSMASRLHRQSAGALLHIHQRGSLGMQMSITTLGKFCLTPPAPCTAQGTPLGDLLDQSVHSGKSSADAFLRPVPRTHATARFGRPQNAGRMLCCCFCSAFCRARIARRRASLSCISAARFVYSSGHLRSGPLLGHMRI